VIQNHENVASSEYLLKDDMLDMLVAETEANYTPVQNGLPGINAEIDHRKITEETVRALIDGTIDIPRILLVPKGGTNIVYTNFTLQCDFIQYQPVSRELLIQHLGTNIQETLSSTAESAGAIEERLEDYLVRGLIDFEDISYDDENELLYDLSRQLLTHLKSYLKTEDDVRNVVLYYQKQLVNFIHARMLDHQSETCSDFEVKTSKGFTALKEIAFTAEEGVHLLNFRQPDFDKSKIGKLIFNGFSKWLYPIVKFDSDTERRFRLFWNRTVLNGLSPPKANFRFFTKRAMKRPNIFRILSRKPPIRFI
jgi:type III restriction enzyme